MGLRVSGCCACMCALVCVTISNCFVRQGLTAGIQRTKSQEACNSVLEDTRTHWAGVGNQEPVLKQFHFLRKNAGIEWIWFPLAVFEHLDSFSDVFFKNLILLVSRDAMNWSKVTVKTCKMLQIISIPHICSSFKVFFKESRKKLSRFPLKYEKSQLFSTFIIIINVS